MKTLPNIKKKAANIGITDTYEMSLSELYSKEPHLGAGAVGALHVPGETMVDPWLTPIVFAHHAKERGAKV